MPTPTRWARSAWEKHLSSHATRSGGAPAWFNPPHPIARQRWGESRRVAALARVWPSGTRVRWSVSLAPVTLALAQADPVPFGQPVEGPPVNAEQLGGKLLVPSRLPQDAVDVAADNPAEAQRRSGGRPAGRAHRLDTLRRQIPGKQHRGRRHRDPALDGVLELADVSGPIVRDQPRHGLGSDVGNGLGGLGGVRAEEMGGEERDVLASLAQRR